MDYMDTINGCFEAVGALAIFGHCWRLWKDKRVAGVSIPATVFFASWGLWNLAYYPHLDQWASFVGGCGIVTGNCIWIAGMIYYTRKPGGKKLK